MALRRWVSNSILPCGLGENLQKQRGKGMNFQDWFDLYLSTYKRDIKPRTREEYVRQYRVYIAPIIGAKPLEAVTPEDCQAIINAAAAKGERIFSGRCSRFCAPRSARRALPPPLLVTNGRSRPTKHRPEAGSALTESDYLAAVPEISDDLALSLALSRVCAAPKLPG